MKGYDVFKYTFKRSEYVKTMSTKRNINIDNDGETIDSALLFQRLIVLANSNTNAA